MANLSDISKLSLAERVQLVEDIWDTIAADTQQLPLSNAQRAELDRRLETYQQNPSAVSSWPEVRDRIRSAQ